MKFVQTLRDMAIVVLALQWAWHLGAYGYERLGVLGAIIGAMFSAPAIVISPFTAWLLMNRAQTIWFYMLLFTIVVCAIVLWLFKSRIYDEFGREIK